LASGFGQFGVVAALGDVAREFGRVAPGTPWWIKRPLGQRARHRARGHPSGIARKLALIGLADRFGRRAMLLGTVSLGLLLTVASAVSPGYWVVRGDLRLWTPDAQRDERTLPGQRGGANEFA